MKTIAATILALGLLAGAAQAHTYFEELNESAPRSAFEDIGNSAPRSPFDQIRDAAPRSFFEELNESAPRSLPGGTALPGDLAGE